MLDKIYEWVAKIAIGATALIFILVLVLLVGVLLNLYKPIWGEVVKIKGEAPIEFGVVMSNTVKEKDPIEFSVVETIYFESLKDCSINFTTNKENVDVVVQAGEKKKYMYVLRYLGYASFRPVTKQECDNITIKEFQPIK